MDNAAAHAPTDCDSVTIPCPPGRRPCMHFHCPLAAVEGEIWCGTHAAQRKSVLNPKRLRW